MTRAEFLKVVVGAVKIPQSDMDTPFTDDKGWYRIYIATGLKQSLIKMTDYPSKEFQPNLSITRGEAAKIAVRALGKDKEGKKMGYVYMSKKLGILKGDANGNVGMNKKTTRAEAVVIVERILKIQKDSNSVTETPKSLGQINTMIKSLSSFKGKTIVSTNTLLINPNRTNKSSDYTITVEYINKTQTTLIYIFEKPTLNKEFLIELLYCYFPQSNEKVYKVITEVYSLKDINNGSLSSVYDQRNIQVSKIEAGGAILLRIN